MTDNERIAKLMEYTGLSLNKLAVKIGLKTPQTFYDIRNGRHGISKDLADKIKAKYLNLSITWLLTGEGEMLVENNNATPIIEISGPEYKIIPLLPIAARGGTLNDFVVSVKPDDCEKVISPVRDADFAMTVTGDSMAPEYPSGSRILIKKIDERAFIEWGRVYVLDTCNGSVIKKIMPGPTKEQVRCESLNPEFPGFNVSFKDMYGMYRVLMLLTEK